MHFICHGKNVFLIFSPIFSNIYGATGDSTGKSSEGHCCSNVADSNLVAFADANVERQPNPPPKRKRLLTLPFNPSNIHPLYPKLELLMCHLSGDPLKAKEFRRKLQGLSYSPGGLVLQANTKFTTKSGNCSAVNGTLIHFKPLCKMV